MLFFQILYLGEWEIFVWTDLPFHPCCALLGRWSTRPSTFWPMNAFEGRSKGAFWFSSYCASTNDIFLFFFALASHCLPVTRHVASGEDLFFLFPHPHLNMLPQVQRVAYHPSALLTRRLHWYVAVTSGSQSIVCERKSSSCLPDAWSHFLLLVLQIVGGSDIILEMYQTGELQEMIEIAAAS